jgi:hypothetical protein
MNASTSPPAMTVTVVHFVDAEVIEQRGFATVGVAANGTSDADKPWAKPPASLSGAWRYVPKRGGLSAVTAPLQAPGCPSDPVVWYPTGLTATWDKGRNCLDRAAAKGRPTEHSRLGWGGLC